MPTATATPKKTLTKKIVKDLMWYIKEVCGGMDVMTFNSQREADEYGHTFRAIEPNANVEIAAMTVRIRV